MSVNTTNSFLILGKTYVQTTPGMAPNDLYANSNELQKKFIQIASVKVILRPFKVGTLPPVLVPGRKL
mgnify:CR=1 FL=1